MDDLFEFSGDQHQPLAARMRPRSLDEFIGQDHILAPGRLLRRAILADQLTSLIFFGPPGCGKTTLAHVIAQTTQARFFSLNAVLAGLKDLRDIIDQAQEQKKLYQRKSILFIDEVHRWNKSQQDALLPWTENGTIILIGATTENPYFRVNPALISRSRLFQLRALEEKDLCMAAQQALSDPQRGYGRYNIKFDKEALDHLIHTASGDCRNLFNAIELAVETTPPQFPPLQGDLIHITREIAEDSIQKKAILYDQDGDYHYDNISAFIKSVRGSDPDAALYWLAQMVAAGEDPSFIWRRLLILASEDIGLADPHAINVVVSCMDAFERMGFPEGHYPLAHATLYLATTEKSNSTMGFFDALKVVEKTGPRSEVPNHLCDKNRDGQALGHGQGYHYPHAFRDHWVAQQYLPTALQGQVFYQPTLQGYEGKIREKILRYRALQLSGEQTETNDMIYTVLSKEDENKQKQWQKRLEVDYQGMQQIRTVIFEKLALPPHARVYIEGEQIDYLVFEALRTYPSGGVYARVKTQRRKEQLIFQSKELDQALRPNVATDDEVENLSQFPNIYEAVLLSHPSKDPQVLLANFGPQVKEGGALVVILAGKVTSLADIFLPYLDDVSVSILRNAEGILDKRLHHHYWQRLLQDVGSTFDVFEWSAQNRRVLTKEQMQRWLCAESALVQVMQEQSIPFEQIEHLKSILSGQSTEVDWPRHYKIFIIKV
ncbi:MAG: AAA family ATPase [Spirochaetia bacterium]